MTDTLGNRLRQRRGVLGLTQDELAVRAGLARTSLVDLEAGRVLRPRVGTCRKLATALGISVEALLGLEAVSTEERGPISKASVGILPGSTSERKEERSDSAAGVRPGPPAGHPECRDGRETLDGPEKRDRPEKRVPGGDTGGDAVAAAFDGLTNPVVAEFRAEQGERFRDWSESDWRELASVVGVGGGLTRSGIEAWAERVQKNREVLRKLKVVLQTHLAVTAEAVIEALYRQVTDWSGFATTVRASVSDADRDGPGSSPASDRR